jgi:hypothetical protein
VDAAQQALTAILLVIENSRSEEGQDATTGLAAKTEKLYALQACRREVLQLYSIGEVSLNIDQ